jgi:hypothetical protein
MRERGMMAPEFPVAAGWPLQWRRTLSARFAVGIAEKDECW